MPEWKSFTMTMFSIHVCDNEEVSQNGLFRTNKSPLLMTYLHKIDPANHPAANCPLCNDPNHDSLHLFNCPDIPTTLTVWDLWTDPVGVRCLTCGGRSWAGPERGSEILCVLTHGMGSTPPPQPQARMEVFHLDHDHVQYTCV